MRQAREGLLEGMAVWHDSFRQHIPVEEPAHLLHTADLQSLAQI